MKIKPDSKSIFRTYTIPIKDLIFTEEQKPILYDIVDNCLVEKITHTIDFSAIVESSKRETIEECYIEEYNVVLNTLEEK